MSKHLRPFMLGVVTFLTVECVLGSNGHLRLVVGTVVASDGSPIPNASVEAVQLTSGNQDINICQLQWSKVDKDGRFRLNLSPGRYEIRAKDETDGYPDPNFLLSKDPNSDFPVITVDNQELSEIKVRLGSKGGILEGELLDQATLSPIEKGKITIADAEQPSIFVEVFTDKEGRFQFVVPNKAILVSGSAPGHAGSPRQQVILAEGEHRKMTIDLLAARRED
jgi:Carboxypeptidase regulatory-like domain